MAGCVFCHQSPVAVLRLVFRAKQANNRVPIRGAEEERKRLAGLKQVSEPHFVPLPVCPCAILVEQLICGRQLWKVLILYPA